MSRTNHRALIDPLEPRRMMAVFNATEHSDRISIWMSPADNGVRVILDNNAPAIIVGQQLTINTLGGNDTVTFMSLGPGISGSHLITVDLGAGDDTFEQSDFNSLNGSATIIGGAGDDSMLFDDSFGTAAGSFVLGSTSNGFRLGTAQFGFIYDQIEDLELTEGNGPDRIVLEKKLSTTNVTISAGGGVDEIVAGGGDIDNSGFAPSNTTIFGGLGNDYIIFDDRLDDYSVFESESLTLANNFVTKGSAGFTYAGFDSQLVATADVITGPLFAGNAINIQGINGLINKTAILGGSVRDNTINLSSANLVNVSGILEAHFGTAGGVITFNDQSDTSGRTYRLTEGQVLEPRAISYTGPAGFNLLGGSGSDLIVVDSVAAGQSVFASGGGGDDSVFVGGGSFAGIHAPVHFSGGAGAADKIVFSNDLDFAADPIDSTLTNSSFKSGDGPLHQFFNGVEQVQVAIASSGGTNLSVDSSSAALSITGGSGDDHVTIRNLLNDVTYNATVGVNGDSIVIDDSAKTTTDAYIFQGNTVHCSGGTLTLTGVERATVYGTSSHNDMRVDFTSMDVRLYGNAGNDSITVYDSTGFVTVNTGSEQPNPFSPMGDSISINNDSTSPGDVTGKVRIDEEDTIFHLQIFDGGILRIENNAVLRKAASENPFPMFLKGVIDLAGGALLYRADGLNNPFRQWLTTGHNGGAWNGTATTGAINSSLANSSPMGDCVGYGLGSQIGINTIGDFPINPNDVLLRHTFQGDVNLDGAVDITDLGILATNWQQSHRVFADGDFNYDGAVDITDLGSLATNWQQPHRLASSSTAPTKRPNRLASEILSI